MGIEQLSPVGNFPHWGFPERDLLMTLSNTKCWNIFSGNVGAITPWPQRLIYTLLLTLLLLKLLNRVKQERAKIILITPAWLRQIWLPDLIRLSLQPPLCLPLSTDLLTQESGKLKHPNCSQLHFKAWLLNCSRGYLKFCSLEISKGLLNSTKPSTQKNPKPLPAKMEESRDDYLTHVLD